MKQSFTILELSVVLAVMSVILVISIAGTTTLLKNSLDEKNKAKILLVQKSLKNYFHHYGRLPKPARFDIRKSSEDYGNEAIEPNQWSADTDYYSSTFNINKANDLNEEKLNKINFDTVIYYGIIPFKELKISEQDAIDIYGNYIEYYVPKVMTIPNYSNVSIKNESSFITNNKIIKTGYSERTTKSGMYDSYFCPAQHNKTPDKMCDKYNDVAYGINFKQQIIPDDYVQLSYIESSGEQFINTNIVPQESKIQIIFKFEPTNFFPNGEYNYFYGTPQSKWFSFEYSPSSSNEETAYWNTGSTTFLAKHKGIKLNKECEYNITYSDQTMNIKGLYKTTATYEGQLPNDNLYFFSNGNVECNSSMKLFYLKIYKNNELVRDYIPCYRKTDNKVGLYDVINNNFYQNSGTSTFIKGMEQQSDYIEYIIPSYGIRVKNVKTNDFVDKNGKIAYLLLSHGKNGNSTCAIQNASSKDTTPKVISLLTAINANYETKYEAQNCMTITNNPSLDIVGRNEFLLSKNKEITFYQDEKNSNFDDIASFQTLDEIFT